MTPAFDVPDAWRQVLASVLATAKSTALAKLLEERARAGIEIYPPRQDRFRALDLVAPDAVKCVILGQDPYHGEAQAHGLAFSVPNGVAIPPSLRNVFKELRRDLCIEPPKHGFLESWAKQGVLLLNTVLSVEDGRAGSHQGLGWEEITDAAIAHVGAQQGPTVFMLWGNHAQKKKSLINGSRHLILEAPHPSPLSAHRGFLGCGHFGLANWFLRENDVMPIDWQISA